MKLQLILFATLLLVLSAAFTSANKKQRGTKLFLDQSPYKQRALLEKDDEQETSAEHSHESSEQFWSKLFGSSSGRGRGSFRQFMNHVFGDLDDDRREEGDISEEVSTEGEWFVAMFGRNGQWWKGPNVCVNHEEYEEPNDENTSDEAASLVATYCQETDHTYKCTIKVGKAGKMNVRTVTYECCLGFAREEGRTGCTKELSLTNLLETLQNLNLTSFLEAAEGIGLRDRLVSENLTLFVPSNEAMSVTDKDVVSAVVSGTDDRMQFVRNVIQNQIVKGWNKSDQFEDEMLLKTENLGSSLRINFFQTPTPMTTVNCARITSADNQATNALVHVVDRVIVPVTQSILDVVNTHPKLTVLRSLLSEDDQHMLENPEAALTLFAFTDNAFEQLDDQTKERIRSGDVCFKSLLSEHLTYKTICSAAITREAFVRNIAGRYLTVNRKDENSLLVENATISLVDRMATNGVVHLIDKVLISDRMRNALTVIRGTEFAKAIRSQQLDDELNALRNITVFVPSDEAVEAFSKSIENVEDNTELIRQTLRNHVVKGVVPINGTRPLLSLTTIDNQRLTLKTAALSAFGVSSLYFPTPITASVQCVKVARANTNACGATIHYIDKVLERPTLNTMEFMRSNVNLSQFTMFVEVAGLETLLNQAGFEITILAPTNAAIEAKLSLKTINDLLSTKSKATEFVKRHILNEAVCCSAIGDQFLSTTKLRSMTGSSLVGYSVGNLKKVNGAKIVLCDLISTNGILHIIDRPIEKQRRSSFFDLWSNDETDY